MTQYQINRFLRQQNESEPILTPRIFATWPEHPYGAGVCGRLYPQQHAGGKNGLEKAKSTRVPGLAAPFSLLGGQPLTDSGRTIGPCPALSCELSFIQPVTAPVGSKLET